MVEPGEVIAFLGLILGWYLCCAGTAGRKAIWRLASDTAQAVLNSAFTRTAWRWAKEWAPNILGTICAFSWLALFCVGH